MDTEIWKPVIGYEGLYEVSSIGNVKSLNYRRNWIQKILSTVNNNDIYKRVTISKEKKEKCFLVHRLVAMAFIPNPLNLPLACHKNELIVNWKLDNSVENLFWWTHSDNTKDMKIKWRSSFNFKVNNPKSHLWKTWILNHNSKKVNQYSLDWEFIREWDCITDVQRELWIWAGNISSCCIWRYKTAKWYKWEFNI